MTVPIPTNVQVTQTLTVSKGSQVATTAKVYTVPSPATGNGKWLPGFDINTDYTKNMPAGSLKHFDLTINDDTVRSMACS